MTLRNLNAKIWRFRNSTFSSKFFCQDKKLKEVEGSNKQKKREWHLREAHREISET